MTVCPGCQNPCLIGELYCAECGAALLTASAGDLPAGQVERGRAESTARSVQPVLHTQIARSISLLLLKENIKIEVPVSYQQVITLGRIAEGQALHPDIDLTPYDGFDAGVSRLHVSLKFGDPITVTDLHSSNGSKLNNVRMEPYKAYHLKDGDVLVLGKFRLQVFLHGA
jgi:hypothetical protein